MFTIAQLIINVSRHRLFPLQVCIAAILRSQSRPTSGNVGSVTDESGMVANVWVAVGIGSQDHSVQ